MEHVPLYLLVCSIRACTSFVWRIVRLNPHTVTWLTHRLETSTTLNTSTRAMVNTHTVTGTVTMQYAADCVNMITGTVTVYDVDCVYIITGTRLCIEQSMSTLTGAM